MVSLKIISISTVCVHVYIYSVDRIELCDSLSEGGTTPSFGMIAEAVEVYASNHFQHRYKNT